MAESTSDWEDWQSEKDLSSCFSHMYEEELNTDVTFTFLDTKTVVKAHKMVLRARSSVFERMFYGSLPEDGSDVKIEDVDRDAFHVFIKYLYTDDQSLVNPNNAHAILYMAEKYQVLHLKRLCENLRDLDIDESNPLENLDNAVLSQQKDLIEKFLVAVLKQGAVTREMLTRANIRRDTLELIVDCDYLGMSEVNVFRMCNDWAVRECTDKGYPATPEKKREVLGPVFFKIRLPTLTSKDLVEYVAPASYLSKEEELMILRYQTGIKRNTHPFNCMPRKGLKMKFDNTKNVLMIESFKPKWKLLGLVSARPMDLNVSFQGNGAAIYGEYCVRLLSGKNYFPGANLVAAVPQTQLIVVNRGQAATQNWVTACPPIGFEFGPEQVAEVDLGANMPITAVIFAVSRASF